MKRIRVALVALILLLGLAQRVSLACSLPVDADEPVYSWAASYYAGLMARGEWEQIPQYTYTLEHPAFVKLLYGLALWAAGAAGPPDQPFAPPAGFLEWGDEAARLGRLAVNRYVSVLFGALQVLAVTLVNPLSGLLLAVHTMTAKYTSEIYLEAVPACAITMAILSCGRALRRTDGRAGGWLWLSAALLGLAAASKYNYAAAGLVMLPFVFWQQRRRPWNVLLYGLLALAVFFALDPILWPDPVGRLRDSLLFHTRYTQSAEVARYDYPWYQPLLWMSGAGVWHPGQFWFPFDILTFLLSLVGLPFLFRQNRLYFAWLVWGWFLLFIWPTKWPQYTLIITPALCLSAGAIAQAVAERYRLRFDEETWERIAYYLPDREFWIKPSRGLIIAVIVLVTLYTVGYVAVRVERSRQVRGWTTYTMAEGEISGDMVTALALDGAGRVWVGTRSGITLFEGDQATFLYANNSPLSDNRVTALALDSGGRMWIGTESGVNVVEGEEWRSFTAAEMGLPEARVRALAADPRGPLWVGTRRGAAVWDGMAWQAFSPLQAGLQSETVLALTVDAEGRAWMGTERGLAVLDLTGTGPAWITYTAATPGLDSESILALVTDPQGGVWAGTGGGGLCRFASEGWECFRTGNSELPWNSVVALAVDDQGRVWSAAEMPNQPGGAVAAFDGAQWQIYTPRNSGLVTGQVTAILQDRQGRFWFATGGSGLSRFEPPP